MNRKRNQEEDYNDYKHSLKVAEKSKRKFLKGLFVSTTGTIVYGGEYGNFSGLNRKNRRLLGKF